MSEKLAEQLALQVGEKVIKAGIREVILDTLLGEVRSNVHEAMLEALLIYAGKMVQERDTGWIKELSTFLPKNLHPQPKTPAELEQCILAWQASREQVIRREVYRSGHEQGFRKAISEGVKMGWGGCEAGKGLQEVLEASEKVQP